MVTVETAGRSEPDYEFDFCGGHLALDFTNTVGSRGTEPKDHFNTFGDVLAWAQARRVISRAEAVMLKRKAAANPDGARRAFRHAIDLREALYAVLAAFAIGGKPDAESLARLNRHVLKTFGAAQLAPSGAGLALLTPAEEELEAIFVPIVRSAVDLLTSDDVRRVGRCADETCAWLFFDTTRSHTRRWCDMKACGNLSKVRRFRRGS
jgi:predicted RNA-binding Zn ribbon-like protein